MCCRLFNKCSVPVSQMTPSPEDYESRALRKGDLRFEQDSPSPLELLPVNPPLSPDIAQWLEGKNQRRREFLEGCKKARTQFYRVDTCNPTRYLGWSTIGPDTLDGK